MTQILWKRNDFYTFTAQMKIRVGGLNNMPSVDILSGDTFEYDGSICKYAGAEFPQPGLRGAIKEGWATVDPNAGIPMARSASRNVASSKSVNTDLSRVQRQGGNSPIERSDDEETVLEVGDRQAAMDPVTRRGHLTATHNRRDTRGMVVEASDLDSQDHTEISRIKSPAKVKVDVLNNPNAARDIEMRTSEQGYGRYAGQRPQRNTVVHQEGVQIMTQVGSPDAGIGGEETGEVVAEVKTVEARTPKAKPASKSKGGKKESPKLIQATKIYSDFPQDWNFFGKVEDKLARLKEIKPTAELLDALWASESGSTKKALQKAYPKHDFK